MQIFEIDNLIHLKRSLKISSSSLKNLIYSIT